MTEDKGRNLTALPATPVEAEALASVRRLLEQVHHRLSPEFSRDMLRKMLVGNSAYYDARTMIMVAEYARAGNDLCDSVIRDIRLEATNRGEQPPAVATNYIMEMTANAATSRRRRGRRRADYIIRDIIVVLLVEHVIFRFGLRPTRNSASKHPSACSIVAEALGSVSINMTEKAVVAVWTRLSRAVRPTHPQDPFTGLLAF